MDGVPLTQEGVCQVYQIVEYPWSHFTLFPVGTLQEAWQPEKAAGSKERQQGSAVNLDDDEFLLCQVCGSAQELLGKPPGAALHQTPITARIARCR